MSKYIAIPTTQTNDMYGYPCYLFALTESNIAEVNRLKEIFTKCKEIDKDVAQITFYNHSLDFDVTNENFDVTEKKVVSMTDEDVETYTDTTENSYRVEPSFIKVNEFAIYMVYNSKWTSDEVWGEIGFEELENFNKTLTV
jgi:hypothetical protein